MSVRMMTLVWELDLPDSEKLVLLALADCANDEGHCWPGMTTLKKKCTKSDRTIQLAIKMLCGKGHLTRREVPGKGCNYTVRPRGNGAAGVTSPPKGTTQTPEAASGKPSRTINYSAEAEVRELQEAWNTESKTSGLHECRVMNNSRKQMARLRIKEHGLEMMLRAVKLAHASPLFRGSAGDGRRGDITIILQPKTLARVLDGFYGDGPKSAERITDPAVIALNKRATADLYDKMGRTSEADELRREAAQLEQARAA
jgi:hypothetical protein